MSTVSSSSSPLFSIISERLVGEGLVTMGGGLVTMGGGLVTIGGGLVTIGGGLLLVTVG